MTGERDDWRPTAALAEIQLRAELLARARAYFAAEQVLEVDTPVLGRAGVTDVQLASIEARVGGQPGSYFLQTSPEYAMKRLLAAGAPDIYQICKAFRDAERGRHHNREFTLIEWYRHGYDADALMDDVQALLAVLLGTERLGRVERIAYANLLARELGVDPHRAPLGDLVAVARARLGGIEMGPEAGRDAWLDLLMGAVIGPALGLDHLVFVHSYPASQAALARRQPGDPPTAARFEAYLAGIELCNGFHELSDPVEQRARFAADAAERLRLGLAPRAIDERLLSALAAGLPDCAGVALGFDRVLMLAAGAAALDEVLAFPIERA